METNIYSALTLLFIGMITVFVVLALVVTAGKILIRLVNALAGGVELEEVSVTIEPAKLAAITAAVEVITEGKGRITKVERTK